MKRIDVKSILRDRVLRRRLMVPVIIALQAYEGVVTSRKQAEDAYDKIQREKKRTEVTK